MIEAIIAACVAFGGILGYVIKLHSDIQVSKSEIKTLHAEIVELKQDFKEHTKVMAEIRDAINKLSGAIEYLKSGK